MRSIILLFFIAISNALYAQPWAQLVKDANPGSANAMPSGITQLNGTAYYSANDGKHGSELWASDGTAANTRMVKDINPASGTGSNPWNFCALNNKMLFYAMKSDKLITLWSTDGTSAGTIQLCSHSAEGNLMVMGKKAYFIAGFKAPMFGLNIKELWETDGTPQGTKKTGYITADAANQNTYKKVNDYAVINNKLYFSVGPGCSNLYWTDGIDTDTPVHCVSMLREVVDIAGYKNKVSFLCSDGKLYTNDGTSQGTVLVSDFGSQAPSGGGLLQTVADGILIVKDKIWKSDGTTAGTKVIVQNSKYAIRPLFMGKMLYYTSPGPDGNNNLTVIDLSTGKMKILDTSAALFAGAILIPFNNKLLFSGVSNGRTSLHIYDITSEKMTAIPQIKPNHISFRAAISGNEALLSADDGVNGWELWKVTDVPTAIETHHSIAGDVMIYPNPAQRILTLQLKRGVNAKYRLTNLWGQLLLQGDAAQKTEIDISSLPVGAYNLSITAADGTAIIKRFVKQ